MCVLLAFSACQMEEIPTLSEEDVQSIQERIDTAPLQEVKKERPFELYYHQLLKALASRDPEGFNNLVHPEFGCYLIDSPGAIPVITLITDIEKVLQKKAERSVFDFSNAFLSFPITEESLPTIDCDSPNGFYSKEGAFVENVNTLAAEKIWEYIGLDVIEQAPIVKLSRTIDKTIVNTAGFRAYFSKIGDQWYITFFDIRVPCTA
ncbi:MAG: hypothetical protein JKY18_09275 [Flavobacteriales bacterium]|nr:hypothetical protein [Flavobacteriales bacterium]